ncbi:MAG TPA: energy transducer TonB [Blastocatellia bacterium]|nr:energy transducer TonB [Blastocatellia bacterium]
MTRQLDVDSEPEPLTPVQPGYTDEARNHGTHGTVSLRALVGADGKVKDARVIRGLPHGLEEEAIRALRKTNFKPAKKGDLYVPRSIRFDVEFKLD